MSPVPPPDVWVDISTDPAPSPPDCTRAIIGQTVLIDPGSGAYTRYIPADRVAGLVEALEKIKAETKGAFDPDGFNIAEEVWNIAARALAAYKDDRMKVTLKPILPPTDHRLGDLPIGAIVPGRVIAGIGDDLADVLFRIIVGPGSDVYFEPIGRKFPTASRDPDTRIAVAYEPIELEVPE